MAHERRAIRREKKVAPRKARTGEEKERAQDLRLQRKYGITLADRTKRAEQQNYRCKVCGGPLDAHGYPCVDHFHFKIIVVRVSDPLILATGLKWRADAYNEQGSVICNKYEHTKTNARTAVKRAMMPWSIRGILCGKCNYGLGCVERFFDAAAHPENLLPAIEYLRARLTN
jgi:hypothetical protein